MLRVIILLVTISLVINFGYSQKYVTKNGNIKFYSDSPLEKIEGKNNQVSSSLDITTGDFIFKVLVKSFEFEKELMQEHFNDTYMESDQYPESGFKGKISNLKDINFSKDGVYNAVVEGDLTIHGVTKNVKNKGTFEVKGGKIEGKSIFTLLIKDYNIKVPEAVASNVAESVRITIDEVLEKL
jgi:polyisoprenoid-binding protein YceI